MNAASYKCTHRIVLDGDGRPSLVLFLSLKSVMSERLDEALKTFCNIGPTTGF